MRESDPASVAALGRLRAHLPGLLGTIHPADLDRPLGHLQFHSRSRSATRGLPTIARLLHRLGDTGRFPHEWTPRVRADVAGVVELLASVRQPDGRIDWAAFLRVRPLTIDRGMHYLHPAFERLGQAERKLSPATLGLRNKTLNSLQAVRIHTLGQLLRALEAGLRLPSALERTFGDLASALQAFGGAIREEGTIDWLRYAAERGQPVFPAEEIDPRDAAHVLALLPEITRRIVLHDCGEQRWRLLEQHSLVPRPQRKLYKELGASIGRSKERVRQTEKITLTHLRGILLADEYAHSTCRVRESFTSGLRAIVAQVPPAPPAPTTEKEWQALVARLFGETAAESPGALYYLPLLLNREIGEPMGSYLMRQTLRAARRYVTRHRREVTRAQLRAHLVASFPSRAIGEIDLARLVYSGGPFYLHRGRYFCHHPLQRRADRCAAFLRRAGRPLRLEDLLRRHNAGWPDDPYGDSDTLAEALRADKKRRFSKSGRTGTWGLVAWKHVEFGTLTEFARRILQSEGPQSFDALLKRMVASRRVTSGSLSGILCNGKVFRRTAEGLWTVR